MGLLVCHVCIDELSWLAGCGLGLADTSRTSTRHRLLEATSRGPSTRDPLAGLVFEYWLAT